MPMKMFPKMSRKLHKDQRQWKQEGVWLLRKISRYRKRILAVTALGLMGTGMSLLSSIATKELIDAVTGGVPDKIAGAVLAMVILVLGSLVLQAVSSWVGASVHVRVRNEMQRSAYEAVLRAKWEPLEAFRSGDLLNRLNADAYTAADGVIDFIPGLLTSCVKLLGAFLIMLCYDPIMALIALVAAPVTMVFSKAFLGKLRRHDLAMKEMTGEIMSFQEDSFSNLTSIKAFSATERYASRLRQMQKEYENKSLSYQAFRIAVSAGMSVVSLLVTAACFGWGVYQLWIGAISYGTMTMFLQLATTLRSAFSSLVNQVQKLVTVASSTGRIMAVEQLPEECTQVPFGLARETNLGLALRRVSFRYQTGEPVLRTFDFVARPGETIAVTGPSGEGKTTLLRLLLGLVSPSEGTAQLLGEEGAVYLISAGTRMAFSYVPQGNSIISGTVADNLRLLASEATRAEMEQALKIACAWEFVSQFPEGLEHKISGDRGISEGQAQRLAVARALLCKAPILLLDEATSGLDLETEQRMLENLRRSGVVRTCILVTHRPGSAAFCSRSYEIRRGTVTEVNNGNNENH